MAYDNTNRGALFKNDKGGNEKRPDYRGTLNVDGREYDVSSWLKKSKKGETFMSLSVQRKSANGKTEDHAKAAVADFSDDIPF